MAGMGSRGTAARRVLKARRLSFEVSACIVAGRRGAVCEFVWGVRGRGAPATKAIVRSISAGRVVSPTDLAKASKGLNRCRDDGDVGDKTKENAEEERNTRPRWCEWASNRMQEALWFPVQSVSGRSQNLDGLRDVFEVKNCLNRCAGIGSINSMQISIRGRVACQTIKAWASTRNELSFYTTALWYWQQELVWFRTLEKTLAIVDDDHADSIYRCTGSSNLSFRSGVDIKSCFGVEKRYWDLSLFLLVNERDWSTGWMV